jgi:hypothetical protein
VLELAVIFMALTAAIYSFWIMVAVLEWIGNARLPADTWVDEYRLQRRR